MKNLITRSLTGIMIVAVLLSAIYFHKYSFGIVFLLISAGSLYEFYKLSKQSGLQPQQIVGIISGTFIFVCSFLYYSQVVSNRIFFFSLPLLVLIFVIELFRKHPKTLENIAVTLFGIIYAVLPFTFFSFFTFKAVHQTNYIPELLLGFFFLQWASDTGAYIAGMTMGKHKLFKSVSPKKTWEGFAGGIVLTLGITQLIAHYFDFLPWYHWLVIGLLIAIFGTLGDLLQSKFKRNIEVKDSGNILPGHGGLLDRFDSVLLSSPVVFAYLQIIY